MEASKSQGEEQSGVATATGVVAAHHGWDPKKMEINTFTVACTWICSVLASVLSLNSTKKNFPIAISDIKGNSFNNDAALSSYNSSNDDNSYSHTNNNNDNNKVKTVNDISNNSLFSLPVPMKKKTLILDLDETLVHSTVKPVSHHHMTVDVTIDSVSCTFYVIKRPHVDLFMKQVAEWYDVVVFTASMQQYADPLLDQLDIKGVVKQRLFRESCLFKEGNFVKDLYLIGSDLTSTIIVDNSPIAYSNNRENALPIDNWMGDNPNDESLLNMLPILNALRFTSDVRSILSLRTQ